MAKMRYEVEYRIVSGFTSQVEANSEAEAREKFMELRIDDEVYDSIRDGGLDHSEVEIAYIAKAEGANSDG